LEDADTLQDSQVLQHWLRSRVVGARRIQDSQFNFIEAKSWWARSTLIYFRIARKFF
jgi:hypothetical protein